MLRKKPPFLGCGFNKAKYAGQMKYCIEHGLDFGIYKLGPRRIKKMIQRKFLKPGGSVLLDVHSLNVFNKRDEVVTYEYNQLDHFWAAENYYGFLNTFKYGKEKVTLDKYTIIEEKRTRVVYNWLQYFSQDSLREEFEENGLEATEFYADVAGSAFSPDSTDMAVVARKAEHT